MSLVTLKCDKGVNKDLLPSELVDGWVSTCVNYRFRNGFAESFTGGLDTGYAGACEWMHVYDTATTRYLIACGTTLAYATSTNITRYTDGVAIASITRVGTTATLTTTSAHGRSTGHTVSVYGAYPNEFNATGAITVTGATTFTYTIASDPGADASTLGAYSYNVQSNFTGAYYDRITGGSLNGVLIVNNPVDGLYYWAGDTSIRLRKFPFSYVADAGRPFKNYIVQLAPTISGTKYPHDVIWSNAAEPGAIPSSFVASSSNDAGRASLAETGGKLVDCLPLGDILIVYKLDARYAMQYVGGNDVFRFTRLPGSFGVYERQCVVDTPVGHVFLTQDKDVMVHQGGEARSIADGRMRKWLALKMNPLPNTRMFLVKNPEKSEVWVCITSGASVSAGCIYAAVWNWKDDTWGIFEFPDNAFAPITCGANGYWQFGSYRSDVLFTANVGGKVALIHDHSEGYIGPQTSSYQLTTPFISREGITLGDETTVKNLQRSRWNVDFSSYETLPKNITSWHGSSMYQDTAATYVTASIAYGSAAWADKRATGGKYIAAGITTTAVYPIQVRSFTLDVTNGGKR